VYITGDPFGTLHLLFTEKLSYSLTFEKLPVLARNSNDAKKTTKYFYSFFNSYRFFSDFEER